MFLFYLTERRDRFTRWISLSRA